jgi:transposase-like protein
MSLPRIYTDENAARLHFEALLWPSGPTCPHCGNADRKRIAKLEGKSTRPGVYKCRECRKPFSVTVGTVFERSHIKLHQWAFAVHILTSGKKGTSSHQVSRTLGVTYKTAWFMTHRIREAMRALGYTGPLGGNGDIVEADETYFGEIENPSRRRKSKQGNWYTKSGPRNKRAIVSLVERGGKVRSFHVASADKDAVSLIVHENIARESRLHTDESKLYVTVGRGYRAHETVQHTAHEYARGDVHTNSVEGFFSIFKRGMRGNYQHCKEKHLHRYLAEFDFRYNNRIALGVNDAMRADLAIQGAAGKRLTYRRTNEAQL